MRTGLYQKIICYCISAVLCIFYIGVLCLGVCADTEKEYKMYYIEKTLQRWIGVGGLRYTLGEPVDFFSESGNPTQRKGIGWSGAEKDATWTIGTTATLYFSGIPNTEDLVFEVDVLALRPEASARVIANGEAIGEVREVGIHHFLLEKGLIPDSGDLMIELGIQNPSPTENDPRNMGVKVRQARLCQRGQEENK
ncbi:hypothetical protein C814_02749 [Anaerotruncus sp. G3(2012)]|uniref:hypothetical protein n=1 Tax=Anaerotruncus sp. G3(2012) TaxID=1235835 RepID=UPI00033E9673|nr:hypothetical protein [Anaerotruncus sp. G3(2012)]EOS56443.1 hypothetical protein C814_02749 [Anaerotruncus sp. G3(2012)]